MYFKILLSISIFICSFYILVNANATPPSLLPSFYPTSFNQINDTNSYLALGGANIISSAFCDINGDGFIDYVKSDMNLGVIIHLGTSTTLNINYNIQFTGFGLNYDIQCGDLNNDGKDDIVLCDSSVIASSRLFVLYGRDYSSLLSASPLSFNTSYLYNDNRNGFWVVGFSTFTDYGYNKGIGDFNGDGLIDLIFGSSLGVSTTITQVSTYMVYGIQNGIFPTKSGSSEFDLTTLNGENGFTIPNLGAEAIGVGHINNDTYIDVIISNGNQLKVLYGFATPQSPSSTYTPLYDGITSFNITMIDHSISGVFYPVIGIEDLNGDGINEIVFISRGLDRFRVNVINGKDQYPSNLPIARDIDPSVGYKIIADSDTTFFGSLHLHDVNGDGLPDIVCYGSTYQDTVVTPIYSVIFSSFLAPNPYSITTAKLNSTLPFVDPCKGFFMYRSMIEFSMGDINGDGFFDIPVYKVGTSETYILFGRSYFSTSISSNKIKFNDSTDSVGFELFNSISINNTGVCEIQFVKIKIANATTGDQLQFNNPNASLYIANQINDNEITIKSETSLLEALQYISLSTNRDLSEISISIEFGESKEPIYITFEYSPIDSSSLSSSDSSWSSSSSSSSESSSETDKSNKRNIGIIVGPIVAGVIILVAVIIFIIFMVKRKKRDNEDGKEDMKNPPQLKNQVSMTPIYIGGKIQEVEKY